MKRRKYIAGFVITVLTVLLAVLTGKRTLADGQTVLTADIVIDLSGGYWEQKEDDFTAALNLKDGTALVNFFSEHAEITREDTSKRILIDWDRNGTWDFNVSIRNSEFAYYGAVIVPTSECSISGDISIQPKDGDGFRSMTIRVGSNPGKAKFNINAGNCRVVDVVGQSATSAAPGDVLYLIADAMDGQYVKYWTDDAGREYRRFTCSDPERVMVVMPRADLNLKAVIGEQTPLEVDLTEGFFEIGEPDVDPNAVLIGKTLLGQTVKYNTYFVCYFHLNGNDGDVYFGYKYKHNFAKIDQQRKTSVFFIPSNSLKVTGSYEFRVSNSGAYWPIIFKFPDQLPQKTYQIYVEDGLAHDMLTGKNVTAAAPGTVIRAEHPDNKGGYADKDHIWDFSDEPYSQWDFIVMPARDIRLVPASKIGKQTFLETNEAAVYKLNFRQNGDRWECAVPAGDAKAWGLYFPQNMKNFADEYERFGIKYENGMFVMDSGKGLSSDEPKPIQGYSEDDLVFGENTVVALEFQFGEPETLYPISEGYIVSQNGRVPLRSTYAGQEVLILTDENVDYVFVNDVKYIPKNGIVEYTAPKDSITVIQHYIGQEDPTVTPEPTVNPTVTPEPTPSQVPTIGPDQSETGDSGENAEAKKYGNTVTVVLIVITVILLAVLVAVIRHNLKQQGEKSDD